MSVPQQLRYSREHEWVTADDPVQIGVTEYAAEQLGDVVYVSLPDVGTEVEAGQPCGEIESTKSVSDVYSPVNGEVVEVNEAVVDEPGLVNSDPYGEGWLFKVRASSVPEDLLEAEEYTKLIEEG